MKILKAYKTELSANNKQASFLRQCAGTARFVFNWALADRKMRYEKDGSSTSEYKQRTRFNALKRDQCPWIVEYPYAIVESAFANCNAAFQHFFRRVKNGETPGYPKFKRRGGRESFQLRNTKIELDRVRLTNIGWIRLKERGYIPVDARRYGTYATISERAGRWFISILVEEESKQLETSGKAIGVDLGIKALATCSNGKVFDNPRPLVQATRKLNRLQRELSRRKQGGANWRKTKEKLARAYYKVSNIRRHTLHQISHYLTYDLRPAVIVLEDLNVSGMVKNHCLARAISDVGFYELRRQIEYKAGWCGIDVVFADRFEPTSKRCSGCGEIKDALTLTDRLYVCEYCGLEIDRDLNAALNLAALVNEP